jgi:hypothetical protein
VGSAGLQRRLSRRDQPRSHQNRQADVVDGRAEVGDVSAHIPGRGSVSAVDCVAKKISNRQTHNVRVNICFYCFISRLVFCKHSSQSSILYDIFVSKKPYLECYKWNLIWFPIWKFFFSIFHSKHFRRQAARVRTFLVLLHSIFLLVFFTRQMPG